MIDTYATLVRVGVPGGSRVQRLKLRSESLGVQGLSGTVGGEWGTPI